MHDITVFLNARYDEDAKGHSGNHKCWGERNPFRSHWPNEDGPCRVLREVQAKRVILTEHGTMFRNIGWLDEDHEETYGEIEVCARCVTKHSHFPSREEVPEGPCVTVRALAAIYADHSDYRKEWRP